MIDTTNIQILNTRAPIGDSNKYTINFSVQSDGFSTSSARVMIDRNELEELREKDKPQKVLELLKKNICDSKEDTE